MKNMVKFMEKLVKLKFDLFEKIDEKHVKITPKHGKIEIV